MPKILKRTSFGLLRTNPRLTTNVKIVADSKNKVYLESIDADPLLSKAIYKGFEVTGGKYSKDLFRFYSQNGQLPKSIAYNLYEKDSSMDIKNKYNQQYDFTYAFGMYPKNSRLYTEEFSMFAPLWIEKDNVPDYFIIFKMDSPVTFNINDQNLPFDMNLDTSTILNQMVTDPSNFFENYIQKARIIKAFDLTYKSKIGSYIRSHVNDALFPESSIYTAFDKGSLSYWQGISYDEGGFCKKGEDFYADYVLTDKTIIENDNYITDGFLRNSVIQPNILNLEFLFDDIDQETYKFSRYFGLYVSESELGKFDIDKDRLYEDKDNEFYQQPRPSKNFLSVLTGTTSIIQTNERGIKIYPSIGPTGGTSSLVPFSGRLITWSETQNNRLPYVKDVFGNFYSIDSTTNWASTFYQQSGSTASPIPIVDTNYLRIKNTKIDWKNFVLLGSPFTYIKSTPTEMKGRSGFSFKVTGNVSEGDEIRIKYTDWTNPSYANLIDNFTVKAEPTVSGGSNSGLLFSNQGTFSDIAKAISKSINYIQEISQDYVIFQAISRGSEVIVMTYNTSENLNKLEYSLYSDSATFPFSIPYATEEVQSITYLQSPISLSVPIANAKVFKYHFTGGNNNPTSRVLIEKDSLLEFFQTNQKVYIKTKTGYDTIGSYSLYLDSPIKNSNGDIVNFKDYDNYYVINLEDNTQNFDINSSKKLGLSLAEKNTNGYLSIYPIRDFDFDFYDTSYSKDVDSDYISLYNWYKGVTGPSGQIPVFDWTLIGTTGQGFITSILGPSSAFASRGGFQKLNGSIDDYADTQETLINEYDRLKENYLSELCLSSRVVPFINKWVYDDESVDVRENNYRLNVNQAFNYSNFSPSFDEFGTNPKFFTHEWYYLQKYPPYLSFDDKVKSYSYFDYDLYFPAIPLIGVSGATGYLTNLVGATGASANLMSINEDYFLSYFTRETVDSIEIPRDFKYSLFAYGDDLRFSESLFRGSKVLIKDRSEFSDINYNTESLKFLPNVNYNGYKFSSLLTYIDKDFSIFDPSFEHSDKGTLLTCIKNDKWKSITLVIQSKIDDACLSKYLDSGSVEHKFLDRSQLYTFENSLILDGSLLDLSDLKLSGSIISWDNAVGQYFFTVKGGIDSNGIYPNFSQEILQNKDGYYNDVIVGSTPGYYFIFKDIYDVTSFTFKCKRIETSLPTGGLFSQILYPGSGNSYANLKSFSWYSYYINFTAFDIALESTATYLNGGYRSYITMLENISFATIADKINSGDPSIRYVSISETGEIDFNKYVLEISKPDDPIKSMYLEAIPLKEKPKDFQNIASIIGYELINKDRIYLIPINRYRGGYNPRWKDLVKFLDTNDLITEGLSYQNINILSNNGILVDNNLGLLKNMFFNKVNIENSNVILKSSRAYQASPTVLPLIGEVAIDKEDFFIFKSNWDPFYYRKYLKSDRGESVLGTREPKEQKSYFGSKVIAIPSTVKIETFPEGVIDISEIKNKSQIKAVSQNIIKTTITESNKQILQLDVFTELCLQNYLINDGFGDEFYKYINPNYSFGDPVLTDDIKSYIKENILSRYVVKEIIFWEKFWYKGNANLPDIQTDFTDIQKISAGYSKSKNFSTKFLNPDDLNFQLIYNIPLDRNYSIAFDIVLEKK